MDELFSAQTEKELKASSDLSNPFSPNLMPAVSSMNESIDRIVVGERVVNLNKCYTDEGIYCGSYYQSHSDYPIFDFIPVGYEVYYMEGELVAIPGPD